MSKNLVIVTAVFAIFIVVQVGFAAQISVLPGDQPVSKGENFTVEITVDPEGSEVFGAQYELHFNNSLLNATSQSKGPFFGVDANVLKNEINNTLGWVKYGETRTKLPGITNPEVLATIIFQAIAERGTSELSFTVAKLSDTSVNPIPAGVNNETVKIMSSQPPRPFLIYGYVFSDSSECNNPKVSVTNLNTSNKWQAETSDTSNYYQLMLASATDIIAGDVLHFNVSSPDGSQSNTTNHTITQQEINNGGLFNFNIPLKAKPGADVFDTGSPENPYPSISGTHNGTIKPNQNITINRIYTYPCAGTGGHTEFVRIWGHDEDAYAIWNGYVNDWHNRSFNRTFTLENGKEYNFTIRTGSYPQIHHTPALPTATGWINCTSFVDANEVVHNNWIPAIRLEKIE